MRYDHVHLRQLYKAKQFNKDAALSLKAHVWNGAEAAGDGRAGEGPGAQCLLARGFGCAAPCGCMLY